jgi:hypothetical protein
MLNLQRHNGASPSSGRFAGGVLDAKVARTALAHANFASSVTAWDGGGVADRRT